MAYDFSQLTKKIEETKAWLQNEYSSIRTSRATPALLDSVVVDAYSAKVPVNQIASISVEDARTLYVAPYDAGLIKEIERAITQADLGVSVRTDERGTRILFPELTSERRDQLIKLVRDKFEDARISIRGVRDEVWSNIQKKEKRDEITEDEKFRYKDDMQELVDTANEELEAQMERKEQEIRR